MGNQKLKVYNTLSRKKEDFEPLSPPAVGMYVCGPTVYGDAHLGHARPAITFDLVYRYLLHLGFKVRYVRNITDVGHLVNDADEGEDKIAKKARAEQLEPMEVAQHFTNRYLHNMDQLNVRRPSIEPRASGHIIEQIEFVKEILANGFAYESDGSVYFDLPAFHEKHVYGKLSGRVLDDLLATTRELNGQQEKKNAADFALWKKASPDHIMRWPSPWSDGFPGWHLECSAMGKKYLGETFDIHGGGMDLLFPHHESEIAQAVAANGKEPVKYWLHNNMITINGQKMGKSLNNFITLNEFFAGEHDSLEQAYHPMTIRFFILQAHYRSTLDFGNDALKAAEKGFARLMKGMGTLENVKASAESTFNPEEIEQKCYEAMNDDFNSPILISHLFDGLRFINNLAEGREKLNQKDLDKLKTTYKVFIFDILGLMSGESEGNNSELLDGLMDVLLEIRKEARTKKDFATSDLIRDKVAEMNIEIKDTKEGAQWNFKK